MARSRSSRASSTPRFDAASISMTSRLADPLQIRWQESQTPHGSPSGVRFSQLSAIASTRASVVFPTPRGPHRRYPCATRPRAMAPLSVFETCDWTATDAKFRGRYLRARASIKIRNRELGTEPQTASGREAASLVQRAWHLNEAPNFMRAGGAFNLSLAGGKLAWKSSNRLSVPRPLFPVPVRHREYSRSDEATLDTTCRCYLRGPDGVSGPTPSGTWSTEKGSRPRVSIQPRSSTSRTIATASSISDVETSDCPKPFRRPDTQEYPAARERSCNTGRGGVGRQVDHHDVRIRRHDARTTRILHARTEATGIGVIVAETLAIVLDTEQRPGSDHAGLAKCAAQSFARRPRRVHDVDRPGERRADRCAEPLRERHHDGIGTGSVVAHGHAGGCFDVPESRAVEMERQVHVVRRVRNLPECMQRGDRPAGTVVRVFYADERSTGGIARRGTGRSFE